MSLHVVEPSPVELAGMKKHGFAIGKPSQLSDAFRLGVQHGLTQVQGAYVVRVKQECSACPFTGKCEQCNGRGHYYTQQRVRGSNITRVSDHD